MKDYIDNLKKEGKLIAARPLKREGIIISGFRGAWKEVPLYEKGEAQARNYHILAQNQDEAIAMTRKNHEFEYGTTARIEVRTIKMKQETNGHVYPKTV